jgi:hypothetical protein
LVLHLATAAVDFDTVLAEPHHDGDGDDDASVHHYTTHYISSSASSLRGHLAQSARPLIIGAGSDRPSE